MRSLSDLAIRYFTKGPYTLHTTITTTTTTTNSLSFPTGDGNSFGMDSERGASPINEIAERRDDFDDSIKG